MKKQLKNYITICLDASGSMASLKNDVIKVFNNQIQYLAERSRELDQETRISLYSFNTEIKNLLWDVDVLRIPSIEKDYYTSGQTALIDAVLKSIEDLERIPQIYSDDSYLHFTISDGCENASRNRDTVLKNKIDSMPDNWTFGFLAPDVNAVSEAKRAGFSAGNIQLWATTSKGIEEAGGNLRAATENFFINRSKGVRSTKSLFKVDVANLSKTVVKTQLEELKPNEYELLPVHKDSAIREYVESWTKRTYVVNSAYYELSKPEKIQAYKQICVQDKKTGKIYTGQNGRKLLNLPDQEVKVSPGDFGSYRIFVQSSSVNRKLLNGTQVLVMK